MARADADDRRFDTPKGMRRSVSFRGSVDKDRFGRFSEAFARGMGTSGFLIGMTVFVVVWLGWNTFMPADLQFDPRATNFTLLTLILSLQASYAAPLILLAQNRQADRDRVQFEQDRALSERTVADTEYLAREIAAIRVSLGEVATRDYIRGELQRLLDELQPDGEDGSGRRDDARGKKDKKAAKKDDLIIED